MLLLLLLLLLLCMVSRDVSQVSVLIYHVPPLSLRPCSQSKGVSDRLKRQRSFTLREERRLIEFENMILRRIFGSKRN